MWCNLRDLCTDDGEYNMSLIVSANTFFHLDAPVQRVTGMDIPTPYAFNLEDLTFPKTHNIVKAIKNCLNV